METKKLIDKFTKEYGEHIDLWGWSHISSHHKLSEEFMMEFKDKVNWNKISYYQKLSEDFIREFKDKVNWIYISHYQKLSEDFIRKFKDKVNWNKISYYQKLSEDFIREFKDNVEWGYISSCQELSEDFIREFQDEIDFQRLLINKHCPLNIKVKYDIDEFQKNIENNKFTKEDSSKHSIEYSEKIEIEDNSLNELKKLIE